MDNENAHTTSFETSKDDDLEKLLLEAKLWNLINFEKREKMFSLNCPDITKLGEALSDDEKEPTLKGLNKLKEWAEKEKVEEIVKFIDAVIDRLFPGVLQGHMGASGIYKIWEGMKKKKKKKIESGEEKLLNIAEFREEMGSFRNKVAELLNDEYKDIEGQNKGIGNLRCFTSDICMAIHFVKEKSEMKNKIKIQCSTCRHDNDLYVPKTNVMDGTSPNPRATFHDVADITEVCIKGDSEAMVYLCKEHVTGPRNLFIEHLDRYDLFNSEGVPL